MPNLIDSDYIRCQGCGQSFIYGLRNITDWRCGICIQLLGLNQKLDQILYEISRKSNKEIARSEVITRMMSRGDLDPDCPGCQSRYAAEDPTMVFAPHHKASDRCQSGKRNHCTCDTCF